jgi:hypothetical protein
VAGPAVRGCAFDREPGRVDAPQSARVAGGSAHGGAQCLRGHLAETGIVAPEGATRAYDLKRLAADGFDEYGEVVVPTACAWRFARLSIRSTGFVTLLCSEREVSAPQGLLGGSDRRVPRVRRRSAERAVRLGRGEMALDVESVVDGGVG